MLFLRALCIVRTAAAAAAAAAACGRDRPRQWPWLVSLQCSENILLYEFLLLNCNRLDIDQEGVTDRLVMRETYMRMVCVA